MPESTSRAAGDSGRPALRRCVAVDPATFAAEYWSHRPLLSAGTGDFADLLTLDDVDELISRRGLRTPFLRIAKDGAVVEAARFTRSGGAGAEVADQVADDRVLDLFADGATLVLQGLHRVWPPVIAFAQRLQGELGHPVQVNAYVTPPQSRGFSAHYDVHDVFVLQVAGEKRWLIHPPVLERPLRDQPWTSVAPAVAEAARAAPAIDTVLRPGDALYLPRGWLHAAEALGDVSCHLTVGVHPVTGYHLVEALTAAAASAPELRASLPLGVDLGDPVQLAPHVAAVIETLRGWLPTADPEEVAERVRTTVWARSRPEPVGPLAQSAALRGIDQSTTVRRRAHLAARLRAAGGRLVLQLADRRLTLPQSTEPALKALLGGDPVTVSELPGLDPDERLVLVRRLLREAVVVPVSSPAPPGLAADSSAAG